MPRLAPRPVVQLGLPGVPRPRPRAPLTLGIDEAGRGPVLGPMVVAAVVLDPVAARALTRAGIADSKRFGAGAEARARRASLALLVRERARFVAMEVVEAAEIDQRVARNELNVLERECAERMIRRAPPCARVLADGARLFGPLRDVFPHLRAHDNGEARHAAVAAASIVAKDERDRRFARLCERWRDEFGELAGGGYLNAATRAFLRAYRDRHGDWPDETRRSWSFRV